MFEIKADITGLIKLKRDIGQFNRLLLQNKELFEELIKEIKNTSSKRFANEGAYDGHAKWLPLKNSYKKWKDKNYPGQKILSLRGNLLRAITSDKAAAQIKSVKSTSAVFGVRSGGNKPKTGYGLNPIRLHYAILHQTGDTMPERPFFDISASQLERFSKIIQRDIQNKLKKSNFKII